MSQVGGHASAFAEQRSSGLLRSVEAVTEARSRGRVRRRRRPRLAGQRAAAPQPSPPASPSASVRTFRASLAPTAPATFFRRHLGKSSCHIAGESDRFGALFSWSEVNRILTQHRLTAPRLRLVREGRTISQDQYFADRGALRGGSASRLLSGGFLNGLQAGATLIIDNIDEMSPAVA